MDETFSPLCSMNVMLKHVSESHSRDDSLMSKFCRRGENSRVLRPDHSSFPVILKVGNVGNVGNVGIFVLLKFKKVS